MIYKSYEELAGKTLVKGDELVFIFEMEKYNYSVECDYLKSRSSGNDSIIIDLGLDKYQFATTVYGYDVISGGFPETKRDDYEALTKITLAIFQLCSGKTVVEIPTCTVKIDTTKFTTNMIKLTADYNAEIHKEYVQVGCQTIPKAKIEKILNKMNTL